MANPNKTGSKKASVKKTDDPEKIEWKQSFAAKLRQLIVAKGVSDNKAASEVKVDGKTFRQYLDAESVPSALVIRNIADYFGVTTDYLIYNPDTSFGPTTIANLGALVKDCKLSYDRQASDDDTLVLQVEDRILSMILKELLLSKGSSDYNAVVNRLMRLFGDVKSIHGQLVDYHMFRYLVRQEFLYQNIDKEDITYNADGSQSLNWDDHDELILRSEQWDQMDEEEHEAWWKLYSAGERDDAEEVVLNRKVQESPDTEESEED